MGRVGPPGGDAGSELGLQSQVVVGPLIQEWGGGSCQPEGTARLRLGSKLLQKEGMFSALFWCLRGSMAVLSAVLNVQCSTEHAAAAPPTCDGSHPPRPTRAWVVRHCFPASPQQDLPGV